MTYITVRCLGSSGSDVTGSRQGVAVIYKRVYLIFTTKMPGVAEVAAFCDLYSSTSYCVMVSVTIP